MPRPMLKTPSVQNNSANLLNLTPNTESKQQIQTHDKFMTDKLLRNKRSQKYIDAMTKLDAGGHVHNQHHVDKILDAIREEFPEIEMTGIMLGIVSVCYLGKPYEVHTLDMTGQIITHYKSGQQLPGGLERARNIAMRGGYAFIEVYVDCLRAVSSTGAVSVITG